MRYYISRTTPYISDIGSFFDDFFTAGSSAKKFPPVDIYETADAYVIEAETAGYSDDEIRVYAKDGTLTISSTETLKARIEKRREARSLISSEIETPQFSRSFSLPEGLDESNIGAEFSNGILSLTLPKLPEEKPRHIEVKISRK